MIWYLVICGMNFYNSVCTFSPPFTSQKQCEFVKSKVEDIKYSESSKYRESKCIGVTK